MALGRPLAPLPCNWETQSCRHVLEDWDNLPQTAHTAPELGDAFWVATRPEPSIEAKLETTSQPSYVSKEIIMILRRHICYARIYHHS